MANLILNGSTSGSVTISSPAVSGTTTLTLPTTSGTVLTTGSTFAGTGPAFSAYATTTQSCTSGAQTKITFAGEYFDTNSNFSSSRFTPTVAGYYFITGSVTFNNNVNNIGSYTHIYKNGSCIATASGTANTGTYGASSISTLTYLNGSTDYIEVYCTQTAGVTKDTVITVINTYDGVTFSGYLARSA